MTRNLTSVFLQLGSIINSFKIYFDMDTEHTEDRKRIRVSDFIFEHKVCSNLTKMKQIQDIDLKSVYYYVIA